MIEISSQRNSDGQIPLGGTIGFDFVISDPIEIETRSFLVQDNVFYVKPISDWNKDRTIRIFPEAPGKYCLVVEWRAENQQHGRVEYPFEMIVYKIHAEPSPNRFPFRRKEPIIEKRVANLSQVPIRIRFDERYDIWAPTEWEAGLLVGYEPYVYEPLSELIKPGWTVYDVGANLGIYSIWFSELVGERGHIYSFEPNPLCVYFLKANLEANAVKNCSIFPVAISNTNDSINFTLSFTNSALGTVDNSGFYNTTTRHEINLHSFRLDHLYETFRIARPDFVKVDIEGAEKYAFIGMEKNILPFRPIILVEVHGKPAADETFPILQKYNYAYRDLSSGTEFSSAGELLSWFPDRVLQILCFPQ